MELLKEAFDEAYRVIDSSWYWWIVYIIFFILALAVYKKGDRTRRITGKVMIGVSVPGLVKTAGLFGYYLYEALTFYNILNSGEYHGISDSESGRYLMYVVNNEVVIWCFILSAVIFPVLAIVSVVCGVVIIRKKAGKVTGPVLITFGLLTAVYTVWIVKALLMYFAS